jgi:hypothetical protein
MRLLIALLALLLARPTLATELDGPAILARATQAHGGDGWANARTLVLEGRAVFWGPSGHAPRSTADDYRMWRVFDPDRGTAHAAEGKVRIIARNRGVDLWTVGFDGTDTWNEKGVFPREQADAFWASNFGFGIIRHASKPGFKAERVADDAVGTHPLYMVRLTDPKGGTTLFGIDQRSFAIRTMGFTTPRGWHMRTYADFVRLRNPDWLQARTVTLFYNGVKSNEVYWTRTTVDGPVDPSLFRFSERQRGALSSASETPAAAVRSR